MKAGYFINQAGELRHIVCAVDSDLELNRQPDETFLESDVPPGDAVVTMRGGRRVVELMTVADKIALDQSRRTEMEQYAARRRARAAKIVADVAKGDLTSLQAALEELLS